MTPEDIEAVVRQYERGANEGDTDLLVSLFAEDPTFYDPIGRYEAFAHAATTPEPGHRPAFEGRENLLEFFATCKDYFPNWTYEVVAVFVRTDPPGAAFEWRGHAEREDGSELHVEAVDVFRFDDTGKVETVHGYIASQDTFDWEAQQES